MAKTLVGTYASHDDAERVSGALVALGVAPNRIRLHSRDTAQATEPLPEDRGLSGFIGRMFSGVTGEIANIRKYEAHAEQGGAVLAVEVDDSVDMSSIREAMREGGEVDVHGNAGTDGSAGAGETEAVNARR
ncbi:MAG: hypothetical protein M3Z31_12955 [Pseudomonadota bacterium]|nr:hypothetical protein [Pseudomonadota bacterium]